MSTLLATSRSSRAPVTASAIQAVDHTIALFSRIPHSAIALLARFSVAMTFWMSGQTKIEGLVLDPIGATVEFGWPRISDSALELFRSEYALPLIPPEFAAPMAAVAEHVFPLLLLVGLASRLSAFALLVMTLVIQIFVYPSAFATHGLWAALMLYLMARGPGRVSLDHLVARRVRA
ncbi:DoxX family protein [Luteimonas salinilitoris]|uniref:DoxX family protein n=1 Tax=Luteimonas salinilitoris TaxID=3237697 RepID=A0ABV4HWR1_9GAMM